MPLMHQFLMEKVEWYEACLQKRAADLGYPYVKPVMVQLIKNMERTGPSRMAVLAERLGVTRRRISQIAAEGAKDGLLEIVADPDDRRVALVQLGPAGREIVDAAVTAMTRVEAELARRIGKGNLDRMTQILRMDWGPAEVRLDPKERPAAAIAKATRMPHRRRR